MRQHQPSTAQARSIGAQRSEIQVVADNPLNRICLADEDVGVTCDATSTNVSVETVSPEYAMTLSSHVRRNPSAGAPLVCSTGYGVIVAGPT